MIHRKSLSRVTHRTNTFRKGALESKQIRRSDCGSKHFWLVTFPTGLGPFVRDELTARGARVFREALETSELRFRPSPDKLIELLSLRTATAIFRGIHLPIDRPRGLTSYEYREPLSDLFSQVFSLRPANLFHALRLEGAGNNSPTFRRLGEFFEQITGVPYSPGKDEADLLIRIRPSPEGQGWEVLVRTTPRPLSTRDWRAVNVRGAVSGPIAAAMIELGKPKPTETVLNIPCGSGTILAELFEHQRVKKALGIDLSNEALRASTANLKRWHSLTSLSLVQGNMTTLPLPTGCASVIFSDPPWGEGLGNRMQARRLYHPMFREMHRVLTGNGRLIILSQDEEALHESAKDLFEREQAVKVYQGGFHPTILVYRAKKR